LVSTEAPFDYSTTTAQVVDRKKEESMGRAGSSINDTKDVDR
jgi:hypothetical protein